MRILIIGNMGSTTTDALIASVEVEVTSATRLINGIHTPLWFMSGLEFKSYGKLGQYLLKNINEWMIEAGLVDLELIKDSTRSGGYQMFNILS